ncbi:homeobox protein CDX-1-like isoform X1 [Scyliorhinus canicula]|uniref:homeobox protein CDX-1-like isoform X1 n=1 Tax=Scyliorhinus canicula TaxID=7830 RepID=UPI0018F6C8BA|nr:homeobox protein CDX-1-like isoform X1 [Scyliorhinus canicula]
MYVSYLLDKDMSMYSGSVRHSGINLAAQNFVSPPQYADYTGYHVPGVNLDSHPQSSGSWPSPYGPSREDWGAYAAPTNSVHAINTSPGTMTYTPTDYNSVQAQASAAIQPLNNNLLEPHSPNSQRRNPYQWMRKPNQQLSATGNTHQNRKGDPDVDSQCTNNMYQSSIYNKTRTKDKYRVVYTDHQRLELEKEFHYSRYITIRRKAELAANLGLSERQVKIWFQNRRAKERKLTKKKLQQQQQPQQGPAQLSPVPPGTAASLSVTSGGVLTASGGVLPGTVPQ